jgi:RNA polymerase sigma-B factor
VLSRRQTRERTARALSTRAQATSERRRQELLDYVVSINIGVAKAVVAPYTNRGVETEDLLQFACAALTRAARDFDPGRHGEFLSYAVPAIKGALKKHCRDRGWTLRPPEHIQEA